VKRSLPGVGTFEGDIVVLLRCAQQLEHLGFLHMALQDNLGSGYGSAAKFVTP
jgi:hypothetical protein